MPTEQEVIDAFDSFDDRYVQPMALVKALEKQGFDVDAVPSAINAALANGALIQVASGSIRKP